MISVFIELGHFQLESSLCPPRQSTGPGTSSMLVETDWPFNIGTEKCLSGYDSRRWLTIGLVQGLVLCSDGI
jgi:hypothetical protein